MRKGIGSRRGAALAARLILGTAVVLAGCVASDPALDPGYDEPGAGTADPSAMVMQLNRMNALSLTATRWHLSLAEPCTLHVESRRSDGDTEVGLVDLLAIDVQIKGNLGGSLQAVQVERSGHRTLDSEHLFEADRWTDAVEYASLVKTLQRSCAGRN